MPNNYTNLLTALRCINRTKEQIESVKSNILACYVDNSILHEDELFSGVALDVNTIHGILSMLSERYQKRLEDTHTL